MDSVSFFTVIATVVTVALSWASYLLRLKESGEEELEGAEQRILELMGRFKHVSNIRLEMLERKIEEIKKVIREANDVYSSLVIKMTDLMKIQEEYGKSSEDETDIVKVAPKKVSSGENKGSSEEKLRDIEEDEEFSSASVERRILMLHDEGFSDVEIAKKLGIGVGEVRLMISLFRHSR